MSIRTSARWVMFGVKDSVVRSCVWTSSGVEESYTELITISHTKGGLFLVRFSHSYLFPDVHKSWQVDRLSNGAKVGDQDCRDLWVRNKYSRCFSCLHDQLPWFLTNCFLLPSVNVRGQSTVLSPSHCTGPQGLVNAISTLSHWTLTFPSPRHLRFLHK